MKLVWVLPAKIRRAACSSLV